MASVYQFRVQIEDIKSVDFLLHIHLQNDQLPQYFDLMNKIKEHSKNELDIDTYYIMIKRDNIYKFKFNNDYGLQNAFNSITEKDRLEIKLMKINGVEPYSNTLFKPILKPIFIRRSIQVEEEVSYVRKDSGVCFDLDLLKHNKPALSNIITTMPVQWTPYHNNDYYSLPPTPNSVKLPGLSSLISPPPNYYSSSPLTPPLSAFSVDSPTSKRKRGGSVPHQSQFVCDHVIDVSTGKACSQAFRRSYDLSRHQMIHLKNRPLFNCNTCSKKFTRLDALRRHERIQGHKK